MTDEPCWLAVETGGTKLIARIVRDTTVIAEKRWPTTSPQDAEEAIVAFAAAHRLAGAGVASFGPIIVDSASPRYGEVLATPKPGWAGSNLRAALARRLDVAVAVDTDVNAAALAEQALGAGRGCASVAYVTVGTGIGAGLARDGATLSGALHPEMGHVPVLRRAGDALASTCSFHPSCAEGLAAGPAVQMRLNGAQLEGTPDVFAIVADYIGQLFATVVLAWSPERIVAGGGVLSVPGLRDAAAARMLAALGGYGVGEAIARSAFIAEPVLHDAGADGALLLARRAAHG